MKKRNPIIPVILIILSFILASCAPTGGGGQPTSSANYRTGTQGLNIQFAQNLPPAQIYADQPLDIVLELKLQHGIVVKEPKFEYFTTLGATVDYIFNKIEKK